jgi:anti-sigma factor RsiW
MSTMHPGEDELIAYALGEMDPRERAGIEAHLGACEGCRELARRLGAALAAYRSSESREAPARVLADLLEAQAELRPGRGARGWRLQPILVAAALVVVAGIFASGYWMGRDAARVTGSTAPAVGSPRGGPPARPLPERPAIEFRSEPPLEARFAVAPETSLTTIRDRRASRRDSL